MFFGMSLAFLISVIAAVAIYFLTRKLGNKYGVVILSSMIVALAILAIPLDRDILYGILFVLIAYYIAFLINSRDKKHSV